VNTGQEDLIVDEFVRAAVAFLDGRSAPWPPMAHLVVIWRTALQGTECPRCFMPQRQIDNPNLNPSVRARLPKPAA
jgi:hypothetical protein